MILGFAHITSNHAPSPYTTGELLRNAPEKWPLMARKAAWHHLALRHQQRVSKEVVVYDTGVVDQPGRLDMRLGGEVLIAALDARGESAFLCDGVGFEPTSDGSIYLGSHMPGWCVNVEVRGDRYAPINPPLDIEGYAALAFYCSNVEADRDRAIAAGGRTPTEPFTVKLDREMKIIMLRSPEGTIIELIEVKP